MVAHLPLWGYSAIFSRMVFEPYPLYIPSSVRFGRLISFPIPRGRTGKALVFCIPSLPLHGRRRITEREVLPTVFFFQLGIILLTLLFFSDSGFTLPD